MTITIIRPSTRILTPGARGIRYAQPGGGAAPWWMAAGVTPIVAYQAKGAASYAASKVNLAQPGTYDATEGVAPSWDAATGWISDGTAWLDTGIPSPPNNNWTLISRHNAPGSNSGGRAVIGSSDLPGGVCLAIFWWQLVVWGMNRGYGAVALDARVGVLGVAGQTYYFNGAPIGTCGTTTDQSPYTIALMTTRLASNGNPLSRNMIGSQQAVLIYDQTLSAAQMSMASTAMAAL